MSKQGHYVHPQQLREIWPFIRRMVEAALERDWLRRIPEDVYHQVLSQSDTTALYLCRSSSDGSITGFVVLQRQVRDVPVLSVEWAYHDEGGYSIKDYWEWVLDVARKAGCQRVVIEGPRAYHKVLPGVKLAHCMFEAEVA
jgi:hypothetical protein